MNVNYNNLYCDYIGATGTYSISDYIDITSNTLAINSSNFTSGTSNILNDKIFITSNILNDKITNVDVKYNNLINEKIENSFINTYIYNSNLGGEIRFYNKKPPELNRPDYSVRINNAGYLEVYYNYNSVINGIEQDGYKNIVNEIVSSKASINLLGGFIGTLQLETAGIIGYLIKNRPQNEIGELIEQPVFDRTSTYTAITTGINYMGTRLQNFLFNNRYTLFLGSPIAAIIYSFAQYGAAADASHIIAGAIINQYDSNTTMTPQEKTDLLTYGSNLYINKVYDSLNNLSNINVFLGFINSNIQTEQYIKTLKCDTLNLNTGNITNINGITANELIANGKIKENNKFLDTTYLTSNHLYNLTYNYSSERQYPSKLYSSTQSEDIVSLLGKLVYRNILYLDNTNISYGSGIYEIYSSSTYDTPTTKDKLFNFNTTETTNTPRWGISLYNSGTGNYQGDNSINNVYYGDWVIIKMPNQILLTRYRIYRNTLFTERAPAEWKIYGSNDGITFTEITEASQMTRLISLNYTYNYYDKTLASTFTTQYQYFGFVFNKLLSTSGETTLNFAELQLFGKEIVSNSITSNIYATSNAVKGIVQYDMPNVCKHYGIYCSIQTAININSTTYYKYDLNLSQYLKKGTIQIGAQTGDTYYTFKLSMFYASNYFDLLTAGKPNVCSYDIYQAYKQNGINLTTTYQGLNCCAVGIPPNPLLQNILDIDFWVMRNGAGNIDYITLVAKQSCLVRVVLEDRIG